MANARSCFALPISIRQTIHLQLGELTTSHAQPTAFLLSQRPRFATKRQRPRPRPLSRNLHSQRPLRVQAPQPTRILEDNLTSQNPPLTFPCLDAVESRSASLSQKRSTTSSQPISPDEPSASSASSTTTLRPSTTSGPEPSYTTGAHKTFHSTTPLLLDWGGILPTYKLAYETWGTLNADKSNAILLHTGLSASSHAASTPKNPQKGWWEKFIGPGAPLDTEKYHVICANVLGGCYGSTGPSSVDPSRSSSTKSKDGGRGGEEQQRYATRFPILTMEDMVRSQFALLDYLGINKLYASVGSSMGGMQSLAAGTLFPSRVGRIASISGCARSHPYSIALRHCQRQVLMVDPLWRRGDYYAHIPPHAGMKLAREIATVTYRSGPEWEARFGRRRADEGRMPALCADFLIETYLDHQGEKWCLEYDPNSLLYISKAMDLFDLGKRHQVRIQADRKRREREMAARGGRGSADVDKESDANADALCNLTLPEKPYEEKTGQPSDSTPARSSQPSGTAGDDLVAGLSPLAQAQIPTLVMGVASDILFPSWQQEEVANALKAAGNRQVTHTELGMDKSLFGHDTFLLDLKNVGGGLGSFLG